MKHYQLVFDQKKTATVEEKQMLASGVLMATLAIPLPASMSENEKYLDLQVCCFVRLLYTVVWGGGGKALTMTMTPWNLPHGQWSKKLTMTMMTLSILPWSMVKMTNFDHLTTEILKFWPWSWSKIFDHLTMTPGRRPNGQKIMVILPPPSLHRWSM